jgi:hypothetical protein
MEHLVGAAPSSLQKVSLTAVYGSDSGDLN